MDVGKLDAYTTYDNYELGLPKTLPNLKGSWYILVYPIALKAEVKTQGGLTLYTSESAAESHEQLLTAGLVVRKGPMAYKHDKYKDPDTGEYLPWCDEGDFVVFSRVSYSNTITHEGKKFYVMPDESVLYTVDDIKTVNPMYSYDEQEIEYIRKQIAEFNTQTLPRKELNVR